MILRCLNLEFLFQLCRLRTINVVCAKSLDTNFDRCYSDARGDSLIHSVAERVASFLVIYGDADKEDKDIYTYACELIISSVVNIIVGVVISILMNKLFEGLIFMVCFALLRGVAGGYHAKTHFRCITTFACILTLSLLLLNFATPHIVIIVLGAISVVVIFFLAPMEHENKPITPETRIILKRNSCIIAVVLFSIIVIGTYTFDSHLFTAIALSMVSVCTSLAYAT